MLRSAAYRKRPRKLQRASGRDGGPEGRALKLQEMVTKLIRYERIESTLPRCDEARGYTEQLINLAVQNGDKDRHTMEMADYWIREKDLIHKLFKVLVPRYSHFTNYNYTQMFRLPNKYPGTDNTSMAVLELKYNPWPPILPDQGQNKYLLTNLLLRELYKDMKASGKVDPYRHLGRVAFPNEDESEVSSVEKIDSASVEQFASTKSDEQFASTKSDEQFASTKSDEQFASTKSDDQLDSTESDKQLTSSKSDEQLTSTESDEQLTSSKSDEQLTSTKSDEQLASTESDEQLVSTKADEHLDVKAGEFRIKDDLPYLDDKDKK